MTQNRQKRPPKPPGESTDPSPLHPPPTLSLSHACCSSSHPFSSPPLPLPFPFPFTREVPLGIQIPLLNVTQTTTAFFLHRSNLFTSWRLECLYSPLAHHVVESVGEAHEHHSPLCKLSRYRCQSAADGAVWRQTINRSVPPRLDSIFYFYFCFPSTQLIRFPGYLLLLLTCDAIDVGTLFRASQFLAEELPIRLAHRVQELEDLPDGLNEMPSVQKVKDWYAQSFEVSCFTRVARVLSGSRPPPRCRSHAQPPNGQWPSPPTNNANQMAFL